MKIKLENLEELKHECSLIGLNEVYTELVLHGKIAIDMVKQLQSDNDYLCCDGLGCDECLPW